MNLFWETLTLSTVTPKQYLETSYLYRLLVGLLPEWRKGSFLMQWGDGIAAAIVSLIYGLSPFVPNPLIALLIIAGAAFWFLLTISDDPNQANAPRITPIHIPIFAFWCAGVIATVRSPIRTSALADLRVFTLYLILFVVCARVLTIPRVRNWLILLYMHVGLIVSIYGVRQKYFGAAQLATWVDPESPLSKNTRVYSFLGNPNLLAGYLLPAVIFSLVAIFAWKHAAAKALAGTMFIVNILCFRFADSRGAYIGFAFAIIILTFLLAEWFKDQLTPFWRKWIIPAMLGVYIGLFGIAFIGSETFRLRIVSIFVGRGDSSNNFRINVWMAAIKMIQKYPISGIGPGHNSFNKIYPFFQTPKFSALSAYSVFLEVTVEMGIIGLTAFLWLLAVTFTNGWKQIQRFQTNKQSDGLWVIAAIASLVALLGHGLVDTVWYRPEINTLWWLMVALVASYWVPQRKPVSVADVDSQAATS